MGFTRSFRSNNFGNKSRKEWLKPIMFTAGLGLISDANVIKEKADVNMKIAKIGGPTYRIGMNGGSASSRVSKKSNQFLDKNAVQRGDPEVEQRMNRFVRTCIELGNKNPILSIHDQGAGGNGNVLKEIIEDKGCIIDLEKLTKGDNSMNYLELWLAE